MSRIVKQNLRLSPCLCCDFSFTEECVKTKATRSVFAVRNVTPEEARAAVERVFPKCYADLEPVGRRIRRNSNDMHRAYFESPLYGYDS
uniref:Mitochondrial inner membrane protease ATP23 n=1 Tax=Timema monikensis TaxID=170555 RepID=A0A7R9E8Y9_9NEOP|nr:unnamed protein product [Timema monikensis]